MGIGVSGAQDAAGYTQIAYTGSNNFSIDTVAPQVASWASAADHGGGVGEVALVVPDDGTFSEPRASGIRRLLITFSEVIDSATFTPGSVRIAGNNASNSPVDLSSVGVTTSMRGGNVLNQSEMESLVRSG